MYSLGTLETMFNSLSNFYIYLLTPLFRFSEVAAICGASSSIDNMKISFDFHVNF